MIEKLERSEGKNLGLKITGKLVDEDYNILTPLFEKQIKEEGKSNCLFLLNDFHGWDLHGAWDDFIFGMHFRDSINKVAMVGDKKWEELMTLLAKPFMKGEVRYFDHAEIEKAWEWIEE